MLSISNFSFSFGKHLIFDQINLDFMQGQITGIVGKNGTGKTTLFRTIAGIYPIQVGNIKLNNSKISCNQISFLPTDPYFYPYMKGEEYLKIVSNSVAEFEMSKAYTQALDVPLQELTDNFSTGMRKKLAFAAYIAQDRPVSILDEPYNGVDLESNEIIKQIIKARSKEKIIILSSHILSTITDICDSVYYFEDKEDIKKYSKLEFEALSDKLKAHSKDRLKQLDIDS